MYEFIPETHKYKIIGKKPPISVTSLIELYKNEFDAEYWSEWKAWERLLFPLLDKPLRKKKCNK